MNNVQYERVVHMISRLLESTHNFMRKCTFTLVSRDHILLTITSGKNYDHVSDVCDFSIRPKQVCKIPVARRICSKVIHTSLQ